MNRSREAESPSPEGSLTPRVVRGGAWVFGSRIVNRGLGFIRTIILARLLSPEDFGLLGVAMLAISTIETFTQTGFNTALIQKKNHVEPYLDTAWSVSVIRGILLFLMLFLCAPWVASFFHSPQSTDIIRVIALSSLISGCGNIGTLFFQKELKFHKQFLYEFSVALADVVIAVLLAFWLRDVWALIWSGLAANLVKWFMSYMLHPYRPRFHIDKGSFKELLGFGKWLTGSSILVFLVLQGDSFFVGKMLGITALGLYQMAFLISNLPTTEITHVISQVAFPAYARLQDDRVRLREAYLGVLKITAFIAMPITGGILVLSHEFISVFLGEKWMPMVSTMQILAFAGLIRSIQATTGPFLYGIGKPKAEATWQVVRVVGLFSAIYPFLHLWGMLGVSFAVLLSITVSTIGFCYSVLQETRLGLTVFIKTVAIPLVYSAGMVMFLYALKYFWLFTGPIGFLLLATAGVLCYAAMVVLFDKYLDYGILPFFKNKLTFSP